MSDRGKDITLTDVILKWPGLSLALEKAARNVDAKPKLTGITLTKAIVTVGGIDLKSYSIGS